MGYMTAYALRSYPGAAADTTLNGGITSSALGFSVQPGTGSGYPDGTGGEFYVVVDYDNTSTEKMLCIGRAGDAFTVDPDGRGADGTTAFAHGNGAKVRACWTATDAQESNRAAHNTVGQITTKGDLLAANGPTSLVRVPKTSDNTVLTADSSAAGGWSGKALPGLLSGATLDELTLPDATLPNPAISGAAITGEVTGSPTIDTPTLTEPTIADFTNANHNHTGAAGGGVIPQLILAQKHSTAVAKSTTSGTFANIDATNLTFTFTALSAQVLVKLSAIFGVVAASTTGSEATLHVGLRNSSGTVIQSQVLDVLTPSPGGGLAYTFPAAYACYSMLVTGLTAGTSYTWFWGWALTTGVNAGLVVPGNLGDYPLTEVWSA